MAYRQVDLVDDAPDPAGLAEAVADPKVKAVLIQRSKGYSTRSSLSVDEIGALCAVVRKHNPHAAILVTTAVSSWRRASRFRRGRPGGGLAHQKSGRRSGPTGGYIAGRRDLVEGAAMRPTTPGIGKECGCTLGHNRSLYQGLFLAPTHHGSGG